MKKVVTGLFSLVVIFMMVGCQPKAENKMTENDISIKVSLVEDGKEFKSETIKVADGENLETIMMDHYDAKSEQGMVTEIKGRQQIADDMKYWMFDVNGKPSAVGANAYEVKDGDLIEWKLNKLEM